MARFQWEPETYLELVRADIPAYAQLEEEAAAAGGAGASRVLELGVGTGETTKRVLARHPEATVVGIDESAVMLAKAREELPAERVELRAGRLEDALPEGPFDLVVSAQRSTTSRGRVRLTSSSASPASSLRTDASCSRT